MFRPGSAYVKRCKISFRKGRQDYDSKPTLEILVEGHTDTDPIATDC